jgi:hypothetical protein
MNHIHAAAAVVVLATTAVFSITAVVVAWRFEVRPWLEWARRVVAGLVAVQVVVGALTYGDGNRPKESLHLLYGVVALGVLPAADRFASDAPAKGRAWTFAVAGIFLLLILWRLYATG